MELLDLLDKVSAIGLHKFVGNHLLLSPVCALLRALWVLRKRNLMEIDSSSKMKVSIKIKKSEKSKNELEASWRAGGHHSGTNHPLNLCVLVYLLSFSLTPSPLSSSGSYFSLTLVRACSQTCYPILDSSWRFRSFGFFGLTTSLYVIS